MILNFTGWRSPGPAFHRDMQGMTSAEMEGLTLTVENASEAGTIFVDRLMVSIDDYRYQWSDDQIRTAITVPEIDYGLPAELPTATAAELASLKRIKADLIGFYLDDFKVTNKVIKSIRKKYNPFNLKKQDGVISGVHLATKKQLTIYQKKHLAEQDKQLVAKYVTVRKFVELMEKIAQVWNNTDDVQVRQEMLDKYMLMSEHLLDQGFTHGSSLVATHHWGYTGRSWYSSMLLMEQPLREAGLLEPIFDALLWYSREFKERGFDMRVGPKSSDMDYYNTLAHAHMIMLLLEKGEDRQAALMRKFGEFISGNMEQTPVGYGDGFRPDGTAFRHKGNYPGYSFAAFKNAAHVAYLLRGSEFELSEPAREYLKKVMLAARVYSNPNPGVGTNGRRPFFNVSLKKVTEGYRWLAEAGVDDTGIDKELAQAYLRLVAEQPKREQGSLANNYTAEAHPQGAYTFNYAAMGIYRHGEKMVTMKGWNRYVWSSEIYNNANRYGRYQSHGSVQIQKWGAESEFGYDQNGWDWNRMPGATTIHLPWEQLDSPRKHTLMLMNNSRFSGATDLDGKYGAFGFTLENPTKWPDFIDPSFTAKKSVFSFENRMVLVGSNISNSNSEYPTETTLFQYGLTDKTQPLWVNGQLITEFPYEAQLQQGDWLIDGMGNGYYVVKGGEVNVRRQHQESRDNQNKQPTFGNFASAWVDHGKAPSGVEYEYIIDLDATPESMAELAEQMKDVETRPYEIIRQDSAAHIVRDKATGVTGYTAFTFMRSSDEYVRSISTSAVVMVKGDGDKLAMSVANPDINMDKHTLSQAVPVSVTLKGAWQLAANNDNVSVVRKGSKTVVTVNCKDGIPVQIQLNKV
ncbi:MAG: chondroitin lyase [Moritella sp.]|nr:chondroitin lyase [Moritella sp.]